MEWTTAYRDHTYGLASWALVLPLMGTILAVSGLLRLRAHSPASLSASWRRGVVATLPVAGLGLLAVIGHCGLSVNVGVETALVGGSGRTGWSLFPGMFLLELAGALITTAVASLAVFRGIRAAPGKRPRIALTLVMSGWVLGMGGLATSTYVVAIGRLPYLRDGLGDWVHVGRPARARPQVRRASDLRDFPLVAGHEGWTMGDPVEVDTSEPGTTEVLLTASRPLLTVRRSRRLEVRAEEGDPSFPLAVGNRWVYAERRSRVDSLWRGVERNETVLTLEVVRTRVHRGVRQFGLVRRGSQGSDLVWLHVVAGSTYLHLEEEPRRRREGDDEPGVLRLPPPGSYESFRTPLLAGDCRGVARVGGPYRIPGPCECVVNRSSSAIGFLFAAVTAGAAAPGLSDVTRLALVESHAGDSDERAVNPPRRPAPHAPSDQESPTACEVAAQGDGAE